MLLSKLITDIHVDTEKFLKVSPFEEDWKSLKIEFSFLGENFTLSQIVEQLNVLSG